MDSTLKAAAARRGIPCFTAMAADARRILYEGAYGTRDAASGVPVKVDSIFSIMSMTKAITSLAALQLVDRGRVKLDEALDRYLPELRDRPVLDGFDAQGQARVRPLTKPITLHHLLTHTSGICYDLWDADAFRWQAKATPGARPPLMFEPGARWQYGQGIDVAGRLVEALSGETLEAYFQKNILQPLAMRDTSFVLAPEKFDRYVTLYRRQADGKLLPGDRVMPKPPATYNGGGGLYSTAPDYLRFLQAMLNGGGGLVSKAMLRRMTANHIGPLRAGVMRSNNALVSADVDTHPGESDGHTLAFVVNRRRHEGGRAAGSLAWAGLYNTFYWIDPKSKVCGVILMQFLPFVDKEAVGMLNDFERAVYAR